MAVVPDLAGGLNRHGVEELLRPRRARILVTDTYQGIAISGSLSPLAPAARRTIAWSRPLRGQMLAGGSHGRTASHPCGAPSMEQTTAWADARGRLARAYCFPPMRRKEPHGHPAYFS